VLTSFSFTEPRFSFFFFAMKMTPKRALLCAAFARSDANFVAPEDADENTLLQMHKLNRRHRDRGAQLMQTVQTIVSRVNTKQDPEGCAVASDAARAAVDAALPAIAEQHEHLQNEINIAANAVEVCASREIDGLAMVTQQGDALGSAREEHRGCRQTEHELQDGLAACQQYEDLRNSMGIEICTPLPNDERGWVESMQRSRSQIDAALSQAEPLLESCERAREALANQQAECTAAQQWFEGGYCAYRSSCASLQVCRAAAEEEYLGLREEVQASLESLGSEFQVIKHVECLLGYADQALAENAIVSAESTAACSVPADASELVINFPELGALTTCEPTILFQPPCEAAFFAAEYQDLPQVEAIQAQCQACPAIPLPGNPQVGLNQCGQVNLDNIQPFPGSPPACSCTLVDLQGEYSAGPVVRCENCFDVYRSTDQNSCPSGFKLYSPASAEDWAVLGASTHMDSLANPFSIIDITRSANGCGGCTGAAMNSDSPEQSSWTTSDGSPWSLRSDPFGEPNGDYTANCYLHVWAFETNAPLFNDANCNYHSQTYLCQACAGPTAENPPPPEPDCTCEARNYDGHLDPDHPFWGGYQTITAMDGWVVTYGATGMSALTVTKTGGNGNCIARVATGRDTTGSGAMDYVYQEGAHPYPLPTGNDNVGSIMLNCVANED